jgi:hypothetical protein
LLAGVQAGGGGSAALSSTSEEDFAVREVRTILVFFGEAARLATRLLLSWRWLKPMPIMTWRAVELYVPVQVWLRPLRNVDHVPGWPQQEPAVHVYV